VTAGSDFTGTSRGPLGAASAGPKSHAPQASEIGAGKGDARQAPAASKIGRAPLIAAQCNRPLASLGAIEIARAEHLAILADALVSR
jgi:hypothetical protein